MPKIELSTFVDSTLERCFDLSRSIDLHIISTAGTNEKAIAGRTSGLIELNEFVTWKAKHFGFNFTLTSEIIEFRRPIRFVDIQKEGVFKSFTHTHEFSMEKGKVLMKDTFHFVSPFGVLGELFNTLILKKHSTRLLINRNKIIQEYAETNKWKTILNV